MKLLVSANPCAILHPSKSYPANALNASASIFDSLSDIDSKFAKIADKEYDSISNDVKKWFKKLAVSHYPLQLQSN